MPITLVQNIPKIKDSVFEDVYSLDEIVKFVTLSASKDMVFGAVQDL
ncbi:MAG: hypothetical protein IBX44_05755 [Sulfurospirillum sp.]|nr:hypothetical protein [Sulfurospirillum sp.]